MKTPSSPFVALMAIAALFCSVSEARPIAGNDVATTILPANETYPPFIPERLAPTLLKKRSNAVVRASTAQISEYTKFAGVAATAYCESVVTSNLWNCTQCLDKVPDGKLITTFSTKLTDTTGFVLRSDADKTIYLAFRGTKTVRNDVDDIVFTLANYTPVAGAKVHAGFYASVKDAISDYFPTIQDQLTKYPGYSVVVTGHSLGAAQALIAAMDLYQREPRLTGDNLFVHTVGSPRVGNVAFADYVEATGITYSRSVHETDIVPHVPPREFHYLHAGVEIWTKDDSDIVVCTSDIESDLCADTLAVSSYTVKDHSTYYGINEGSCL